jgi:hypothetical protein
VCAPETPSRDHSYTSSPVLFAKNPDSSCLLIAPQYHEVKINLTPPHRRVPLWAVKSSLPAGTGLSPPPTSSRSSSPASPLRLYLLDTDERRKMAQNPTSTSSSSCVHGRRVRRLLLQQDQAQLQPCKGDHLSSSLTPTSTTVLPDATGILFRTRRPALQLHSTLDALPNAVHAFGGPNAGQGLLHHLSNGFFQMVGATDMGDSTTTYGTTGHFLSPYRNWRREYLNLGHRSRRKPLTTGFQRNRQHSSPLQLRLQRQRLIRVSDAGTFVLARPP